MDGMLSQEEINALLGSMEAEDGADAEDSFPVSSVDVPESDKLTPEETDALGEIANISMGTAATTLSILVNNRVDITTPHVSYITMDELAKQQVTPCVFIYISYRAGLEGNNVLILKESDVKVITDLMMGGDGSNVDSELSDLHLSAICEAMNQMMGSASTSMSSMINEMVDISPPTATRVDFAETFGEELGELMGKTFVQVSFKMEIGDLVNSQIMQLYPVEFARMIYRQFVDTVANDTSADSSSATPASAPQPAAAAPAPATPQPEVAQPQPQPMQQPVNMGMQQQPMAGMQLCQKCIHICCHLLRLHLIFLCQLCNQAISVDVLLQHSTDKFTGMIQCNHPSKIGFIVRKRHKHHIFMHISQNMIFYQTHSDPFVLSFIFLSL